MNTPAIRYIDKIRKKYNASDYKTSQLLEISRGRVSTYRRGRSKTFEDDLSIKAAELLGVDPAEVIAEMHAEKAKTRKEKDVWLKIINTLKTTAPALFVTAIIALASSNETMKTSTYETGNGDNFYIMLNYIYY